MQKKQTDPILSYKLQRKRIAFHVFFRCKLEHIDRNPKLLDGLGKTCHNRAVKKILIYKVSRNDGNVVNQVEVRRRINSRNVVVNGELKRLAELARLQPEGLTFHVARHSFADYARRQSGDLYAVSKTLGHTSLKVTQQYLRSFDRDAVDQLAQNLWIQK